MFGVVFDCVGVGVHIGVGAVFVLLDHFFVFFVVRDVAEDVVHGGDGFVGKVLLLSENDAEVFAGFELT